jgi:membrane protease YdiL (CAAX protease family)
LAGAQVMSLASVRRLRAEQGAALALSALLLLYGNGVSLFSVGARDQFLIWSNLGLLGLLLLWALRVERLSLDQLGLRREAALPSALVGLGLSLLVSAVPVAFIAIVPLLAGEPIEVEGVNDLTAASLAYRLAFRGPVGTALFEEAAFRGVLYACWARAAGDRGALLWTAGVFTLWHGVITSRTVVESNVVESVPAMAIGALVSFAGLFLGGLIFAYLRWHTRSVAAPTMVHWLVVAFMTLTVWARG